MTLDQVEAKLIEQVEQRRMLEVTVPIEHHFAPGVYIRKVLMKEGTLVVGREHKTEHFNIITTGIVRVSIDGKTETIMAPAMFVSKPGVRKVLFILEDTTWLTIHPTEETDISKLEELLVVNTPAFLEHKQRKELECHLSQ